MPEEMGLHLDMARSLLLMVLTTYICTQAAVQRKSSTTDFVNHGQRMKRSLEVSKEYSDGASDRDSDGDSDSEAEELMVARPDNAANFIMQLNGGSQQVTNSSPGSEAVEEEGSGM